MGVSSHSSLHWGVVVGGLFGAACPGVAAIWLFAEAAGQNGGQPGNILRVGFGILLLLISALVIGLAAIYLGPSEERPRSQSHY